MQGEMTLSKAGALSPLTTVLVVWVTSFAVYYSGAIQYEKIPESWGDAYLLVCVLVFALGHIVGRRIERHQHGLVPTLSVAAVEQPFDARRHSKLISVLAFCGIIGAVLFTIEMMYFVGINPSDVNDTRSLYQEREATALSKIASLIGAGGFFSLAAVVLCWEQLSWKTRALWSLSPVSLSVFSVLSAGRQTVFQIVWLVVFSLILRRRLQSKLAKRTTRRLLALAVGLLMVAFLYGVDTGQRRNELSANVTRKDLLLSVFEARLAPSLDSFLENSSPSLRDGIAETLIYFNHQIPSFLVFFELPKPGPYYGLWELPLFARRLENTGIVNMTVKQRMEAVYAQFGQSGRSQQVWQTWIRDLIIDFGALGTLLVLAIIGLAVGEFYARYETDVSLSSSFLYLAVQLCAVYSIMFAPVSDTLVLVFLIGSLFLNRASRRQGVMSIKRLGRMLARTFATGQLG